MKNILVTGAKGQLGLSFQKIKNLYPGYHFVFRSREELDITNIKHVENAFTKQVFDYCINCAAYTNVERAEKEPQVAYEVNAEGVKNLAEACKKYNCALVHISTDYVFDGSKKTPYTVDDIPNPINVYGASKLAGERFIQNILSNFFIVRASWLYHEEFGHNFYKTILSKAENGEDLYVTDEQIGCPTHTESLAKFVMTLLETKPSYGLYHFTDGAAMSWYDFAKKVLSENSHISDVRLYKAMYISPTQRPAYSVLK